MTRRRVSTAEQVIGLLRDIVRTSPKIAIPICILFAIRAIAGQHTSIDGWLKLGTDIQVSEWAAWVLAGTTTFAAYRERRLRRKTIAQTHDYPKELEKRIDPGRSSSTLLPDGKAPKEDRDEP